MSRLEELSEDLRVQCDKIRKRKLHEEEVAAEALTGMDMLENLISQQIEYLMDTYGYNEDDANDLIAAVIADNVERGILPDVDEDSSDEQIRQFVNTFERTSGIKREIESMVADDMTEE